MPNEAIRPSSAMRHALWVAVLFGAVLSFSGCAQFAGFLATSEPEAAPASIRPVSAPPAIRTVDWSTVPDLARLELSFYDEERQALIHVTGPYQVVFFDSERVELIGHVNSSNDAGDRLTLWEKNGELWAHLSMIDAEYLTRVK